MSKLLILKNPKFYIKFFTTFALFISNIIFANNNITAFSNSFTFDNKTGIGTYSGNVVVSDDTKELFANTIKVYRTKSGEINKIVAKGSPARFFDKSKKDDIASGHAEMITYLKIKNLVILEKDATLNNQNNTLKAPKIIYNTKTQIAKTLSSDSQSKKGRTKIVLSNIKD